jgi:hypothetical protein
MMGESTFDIEENGYVGGVRVHSPAMSFCIFPWKQRESGDGESGEGTGLEWTGRDVDVDVDVDVDAGGEVLTEEV